MEEAETTPPLEQEDKEKNIMTVKVMQVDGSNFELNEISNDTLVSELKEKIHELKGIPMERQRLIYRGKLLINGHSCSESRLVDGHTIHLVVQSEVAAAAARAQSATASATPPTLPPPTTTPPLLPPTIVTGGNGTAIRATPGTGGQINGQFLSSILNELSGSRRANRASQAPPGGFGIQHLHQNLASLNTLISAMPNIQEILSTTTGDTSSEPPSSSIALEPSGSALRDDATLENNRRVQTDGTTPTQSPPSRYFSFRSAQDACATDDEQAVDEEMPTSIPSITRQHTSHDLLSIEAPRGTQTMSPKYEQREFVLGQWIDVKDTVNQWLEATVMRMSDDRSQVYVHYNQWPTRWDEWIDVDSDRIAPFRTMTSPAPGSSHLSPTPVSWVPRAPATGSDNLIRMLPQVRERLEMVNVLLSRVEALSGELCELRVQKAEVTAQTSSTGDPALMSCELKVKECEESLTALSRELGPFLDRSGRLLADLGPVMLDRPLLEPVRRSATTAEFATPRRPRSRLLRPTSSLQSSNPAQSSSRYSPIVGSRAHPPVNQDHPEEASPARRVATSEGSVEGSSDDVATVSETTTTNVGRVTATTNVDRVTTTTNVGRVTATTNVDRVTATANDNDTADGAAADGSAEVEDNNEASTRNSHSGPLLRQHLSLPSLSTVFGRIVHRNYQTDAGQPGAATTTGHDVPVRSGNRVGLRLNRPNSSANMGTAPRDRVNGSTETATWSSEGENQRTRSNQSWVFELLRRGARFRTSRHRNQSGEHAPLPPVPAAVSAPPPHPENPGRTRQPPQDSWPMATQRDATEASPNYLRLISSPRNQGGGVGSLDIHLHAVVLNENRPPTAGGNAAPATASATASNSDSSSTSQPGLGASGSPPGSSELGDEQAVSEAVEGQATTGENVHQDHVHGDSQDTEVTSTTSEDQPNPVAGEDTAVDSTAVTAEDNSSSTSESNKATLNANSENAAEVSVETGTSLVTIGESISTTGGRTEESMMQQNSHETSDEYDTVSESELDQLD